MAPSRPRNPIVCSQIVYLIPRKEKKLRGRAFFPQLVQRSYALGSNAHKALMSPLWHASGTHHHENTGVFFPQGLLPQIKGRWLLGSVNCQGFKLGTIGSESLQQATHPMGLQYSHSVESENAGSQIALYKLYIRFNKGNSFYDVS